MRPQGQSRPDSSSTVRAFPCSFACQPGLALSAHRLSWLPWTDAVGHREKEIGSKEKSCRHKSAGVVLRRPSILLVDSGTYVRFRLSLDGIAGPLCGIAVCGNATRNLLTDARPR